MRYKNESKLPHTNYEEHENVKIPQQHTYNEITYSKLKQIGKRDTSVNMIKTCQPTVNLIPHTERKKKNAG